MNKSGGRTAGGQDESKIEGLEATNAGFLDTVRNSKQSESLRESWAQPYLEPSPRPSPTPDQLLTPEKKMMMATLPPTDGTAEASVEATPRQEGASEAKEDAPHDDNDKEYMRRCKSMFMQYAQKHGMDDAMEKYDEFLSRPRDDVLAEPAHLYPAVQEAGDENSEAEESPAVDQNEEAPPEQMYKKGEDYYYGRNGVAKDYEQAVFWYRKSAKQGNARGQYDLGYCYKYGQGVAKDFKQAVFWFRKSADQGNALGQYRLGSCYKNGQGVAMDFKQAVFWYRKSADQGNKDAKKKLSKSWAQPYLEPSPTPEPTPEPSLTPEQMNVKGDDYHYGRNGVAKDFKQAVFWYRKSADQGNALGQCNLGYCYTKGDGVAKDFKQAVFWYRKSADQGNASGQFGLGYCYKYGNGVDQDFKQAVFWYRKSADQGSALGQYCLGECYEKGQGVAKDFKQAVIWYRKSAEQGDKYAKEKLNDNWARPYLEQPGIITKLGRMFGALF